MAVLNVDFSNIPRKDDWEFEEHNDALITRTMDTVVPRALDYVWSGWIPKCYLTLWAGETGAGKTTALADVVARITTGQPWPGEEERHTPGRVLWLGSEDGAEDMTVPRLMAAGADRSKVTEILGVTRDGKRGTFSLQDDVEAVRSRLRAAQANDTPFSLLVIDPITSYLPGKALRKVDMNDSGQIRSILEPWMLLAREFGIAIVAVTHFNKDTTRSMIHRILGSVAFGATCRSYVCIVSLEEEGPFVKAMTQEKMNLPDAPKGGWRFETEKVCVDTDALNGKDINATRVVWGDLDPMLTKASVLGKERGPKSKVALPFSMWVSTLFKFSGAEYMLAQEVKAKAISEGVATESWWNENSKTYLEKKNVNGTWFCRLKTVNETTQSPPTPPTP